MTDLVIETGGDVAYSHSIQHVTLTDKDGKQTAMTVRVSDGYKKVNGQWLIAHEHVSIPVDLETMKGDLMAK
jgi:ketosteroid isomerase-like protein